MYDLPQDFRFGVLSKRAFVPFSNKNLERLPPLPSFEASFWSGFDAEESGELQSVASGHHVVFSLGSAPWRWSNFVGVVRYTGGVRQNRRFFRARLCIASRDRRRIRGGRCNECFFLFLDRPKGRGDGAPSLKGVSVAPRKQTWTGRQAATTPRRGDPVLVKLVEVTATSSWWRRFCEKADRLLSSNCTIEPTAAMCHRCRKEESNLFSAGGTRRNGPRDNFDVDST